MQNVKPLVQIVHAAGIGAWARDRLEPLDANAADRFARFTRAITASDAIWRKHPSWFVASQIAPSHHEIHDEAHLALLETIAPRGAFAARMILPATTDTRSSRTAVSWPAPPLTERSADGRTEVQLIGVDTADGAVAPESITRLASVAALHRGTETTRVIRIVASHHPIPALVREPARLVPGPLAHVHLGAHTNAAEPHASRADLPPFFSPGAFARGDDPWSGSASVLRIYAAHAQPGAIVVERLVAMRSRATGAWGWVPGDARELVGEWVVRA
jgi:hypothetical protein